MKVYGLYEEAISYNNIIKKEVCIGEIGEKIRKTKKSY